MAKYLVDVNLPYYFSFWNSDEFIHLRDINDKMKDEEVWEFAKSNDLTIISKDSDFSNRIILSNPPPRVIHIKIGNVSLKELYRICAFFWQDIMKMNHECKLVNVFSDRIEGIK